MHDLLTMDALTFLAVVATCAPLVDPGTAQALIRVESSFNEYAIGIVRGQLLRQPRTRAEGLATANALRAQGWNFSVGLAQVNVGNFGRLGLTLEEAFEPCSNLAAMQAVLLECFTRARQRFGTSRRSLRPTLSCYYSGNFTTGFDHSYVHRVVEAALSSAARRPTTLQPKESSS
jgi:type IV secretion system protein VirB1